MSEAPTLRARPQRFDWAHTPLAWIPGDPFTSHWMDVMHLAAPVFERGLIQVYKEALPHLHDEALRAELRGFMAQESTHAVAHDMVLAHMRTKGLETAPFVAGVERAWDVITARMRWLPLPARALLLWRLAIGAAGEHVTCILGDWVVSSDGLAAAGADPTMVALLRWHAAEEVEHRTVAFDVLGAIAGRAAYPLRVAAMLFAFPFLASLQLLGVRYLLRHDPNVAGDGRQYGRKDYRRAVERGLLGEGFGAAIGRYMRPSFHPRQEGSDEQARAVLAGA